MNIPLKNTKTSEPVSVQTDFSSREWSILQAQSDALLARYCAQTALAYCNIYVQNRLLHRRIYVPPGQTANQLADFLRRDENNWRRLPKYAVRPGGPAEKLDHLSAFREAAAGRTVVVAFRNPDDARPGHVALLNAAAGLCTSGVRYWNADVPAVDGYNPQTHRVETGESLSRQFSPSKEPDMDYFVFTGNSNP